ncbi:MAG: hypothetical protein V4813_11550 [Gemmatimonadota bacterium]
MHVAAPIPSRAVRIALRALLAAVPFLATAPLVAQPTRPRSDTLSTRVRDSIIADVLADTLDILAEEPLLAPPAFRQSFTVRPTYRRYTVGGVRATEQASYAGWVGRFRRATLRLDLTPVAYSGDTTATDDRPPVEFGGTSPASVRLDVRLRTADTLRIFAQSMSSPGTLSASQAQAIGAVGTSTIDLDASALGIASRIGMRYALTQPIGGGVSLSLRTGVEYDPEPSGTDAVSWRGTTVRGGLGVTRVAGETTVGAGVELTRSFTDSLDGRNLFPGGGMLTVDGRLMRFFGSDGTGFLTVNAFYSRPVDLERPDVATRIIPIGDFLGTTIAVAIPAGALSVLPMLSVLRETSNAQTTVNGIPTTLDASGTTASASLGVSIPIGRRVTVTPEVGGAFGSVGQTVSARFPRRTRSQSFSDPIRGGWVTLELSITR